MTVDAVSFPLSISFRATRDDFEACVAAGTGDSLTRLDPVPRFIEVVVETQHRVDAT